MSLMPLMTMAPPVNSLAQCHSLYLFNAINSQRKRKATQWEKFQLPRPKPWVKHLWILQKGVPTTKLVNKRLSIVWPQFMYTRSHKLSPGQRLLLSTPADGGVVVAATKTWIEKFTDQIGLLAGFFSTQRTHPHPLKLVSGGASEGKRDKNPPFLFIHTPVRFLNNKKRVTSQVEIQQLARGPCLCVVSHRHRHRCHRQAKVDFITRPVVKT